MEVKINYNTGVSHCIPHLILWSKNEEDRKHVQLVADWGFVSANLCSWRSLYCLFKLVSQLAKLHFVEQSLAKWNNHSKTGKRKKDCAKGVLTFNSQ
jgi:hypothetical protein